MCERKEGTKKIEIFMGMIAEWMPRNSMLLATFVIVDFGQRRLYRAPYT